jgi:hypothetical protein
VSIPVRAVGRREKQKRTRDRAHPSGTVPQRVPQLSRGRRIVLLAREAPHRTGLQNQKSGVRVLTAPLALKSEQSVRLRDFSGLV